MTGLRQIIFLCFILLGNLTTIGQTVMTSGPPAGPAQEAAPVPAVASLWDDAVAWAGNRAMPLTTSEPGQGFADLRKLAPSIGSARIVGMGEATHGTREFFQLKHRMFEYLVSEHGFRLFGLEASYAGCLPIDHYVQTGEGNARALVKGQGFWTWDTEEVLALVEWMRSYNARCETPEDRVHFYGIDTQDAARPLRLALARLAKFDPEQAKHLERQLAPAIATRYASDLRNGSMEDYRAVLRSIEDLKTQLSKHRKALGNQLTERGYARVHFAAEAGRYAVMANRPTVNARKPKALRNIRDETMARVVDWILDQHGDESRIMLWAHDGHVTKYRGDPQKDRPFLGSFLEARYGDDYIPVGFSFAKGGFQALYWPKSGEDWARRVLGEYRIGGVIPGSIDHLFSEVGHAQFFLDLRTTDNAVPSWLNQPRKRRSIGGLFDSDDADGPRFTEQVVLHEHFELVVFVNTTSRAVPLSPPPPFRFGAWTKDSDAGGALVTGVADDSIAQRTGLQADDVIRRVAGFAVENVYDLSLALAKLDRPGKVVVQILRRRHDGSYEPQALSLQVPTWVRTKQ